MRTLFLLGMMLFSLPVFSAEAQTLYTVGMPHINDRNHRLPRFEALIREAYARAGAKVTFRYLPMMRDALDADFKSIDASAGRTPEAVEETESLILTETPLIKTSILAYSTLPSVKITAWEDLHPYRVGVLRGDLTTRKIFSEHHLKASAFNSIQSGLAALRLARLDCFVTHTTFILLGELSKNVRDLHASPPLYHGLFHHALNSAHAELAKRISDSLKEMLEDGTSKRLLGESAFLLPDIPLGRDIPLTSP